MHKSPDPFQAQRIPVFHTDVQLPAKLASGLILYWTRRDKTEICHDRRRGCVSSVRAASLEPVSNCFGRG